MPVVPVAPGTIIAVVTEDGMIVLSEVTQGAVQGVTAIQIYSGKGDLAGAAAAFTNAVFKAKP